LKHLSHTGYTGLFAAELLHYDCPQADGLQRTRDFFQKSFRQC